MNSKYITVTDDLGLIYSTIATLILGGGYDSTVPSLISFFFNK